MSANPPPLPRHPATSYRWFLMAAVLHVALAAWYMATPGHSGAVGSGFPLDDAWIHLVYARSVAERGAPYYGDALEAGFSSPLWMLVLACVHALANGLGCAIVPLVKGVGVLAAIGTTATVGQLVLRLGGGGVAAAAGVVLCAANPVLAFAQVSGMEVAVTTLCVTRMLLALANGSYARGGTWAAAAVLGRPECLLLTALAAGVPFLPGAAAGGRRVRRAALVVAPTLAACALWSGYCWLATGHPLPNTFYAKLQLDPDAAPWAATLRLLLQQPGNAWGLGLLIAGVAPFVVRGRRRWLVALTVVVPWLFAFAVARTRPIDAGEYFFFTRYPAPAWPLLAVATALGGAVLLRAARTLPERAPRRIAQAVCMLAALAVLLPHPVALANGALRYASNCQNIDEVQVAFGAWVKANVPAAQTVAVNDAGAIRYHAPNANLDLLGLNSAPVLFARPGLGDVVGDADRMADWLLARGASTLIVFPAWFAPLVEHARFPARFVELHRLTSAHYTVADPRSGQATMVAYRVLPAVPAAAPGR